MIHFRLRYQRLRDRLRDVRRRMALLRAGWMALLVPLVGLVLHLLADAPFWPWVWLAGGLVVFGLAVTWQRRALRDRELGRVLDRRYALDDLLITAVEVDERGAQSPMEERLLDDAATAVAELGQRGQAAESQAVRRELETGLGIALMIAGLWLLTGTLAGLPTVSRLPGLGGGGEGIGLGGDPTQGEGLGSGAGNGNGPGTAGGSGNDGSGQANGPSPALGALASALSDHAAAKGVVDALDKGDPAAAARAARAMADGANALSTQGRDDLTDAIFDAADRVAPLDPALAEALRDAGRALESPREEAASEGLSRLADSLDRQGSAAGGGIVKAAPTGAPRSKPGPPASRLGVDPQSDALTSAPGQAPSVSGGVPGRPNAGAVPAGTQSSPPIVRGGGGGGGAGSAAGGDLGDVPSGLRDAVRSYFAPEGRRP